MSKSEIPNNPPHLSHSPPPDSNPNQTPNPDPNPDSQSITWPLDRPDSWSLIRTYRHAHTRPLPFTNPSKPATSHPHTPWAPLHSSSSLFPHHIQAPAHPLPIPSGSCPTCGSPYTRPLKPLLSSSSHSSNSHHELGLIVSPVSWMELASWDRETRERQVREKTEQERNRGKEERYLARRTAEVLRRRRVMGRQGAAERGVDTNGVDEKEWERMALERAVDVERRRALGMRRAREQAQAAAAAHQGSRQGKNAKGGKAVRKVASTRNLINWDEEKRDGSWTLYLIPAPEEETINKEADNMEQKDTSPLGQVKKKKKEKKEKIKFEHFNSIKLHVTPKELGWPFETLTDGLSIERKYNVFPCLPQTKSREWDELRDRCLGGKIVDCLIVDSARSLSVAVQVRALHKITGLERLSRKLKLLHSMSPSTTENRVKIRLCVSKAKKEEEEACELRRILSLKRRMSLKRELSRKRKLLELLRRDHERQKALDKLEGNTCVLKEGDGEKADSVVDLAELFGNVMLGQRRNCVESHEKMRRSPKKERLQKRRSWVGSIPEETIDDTTPLGELLKT